jgi:PAS domain S-box-containing protein
MIKHDLAGEELKTELQNLRNRVTELEAFHTERHSEAETLQQIEAEAILESYNEGILVLDRKGRVIDANQRLENILGYQRKEFIGKTALSTARFLTHKGLTVVWRNPLKQGVKNDSVPYEIDVFRKDGELVTVQIICQQLKENAKVVGQLIIMKDVTARRRSERELNESVDVYKSLVNHVRIGIFRATAGPGGRFLQVNYAMEEITGYSREDLLKMNIEDLYVHPEERVEHIRGVLSGMATQAREVRFKKKDGTEIVVRDKKVAVRSNDSKTLYLEGFLEDITEQKEAEILLKASEQNFRNSIASSSMGIRIGDVGEQTFYVNQAFLDIFGYKNIDEVKASPPSEHYAPESYADSVLRKDKILRGETIPDQIEVDIIRKDGAIRHLQVSRRDVFWNGKQESQVIYHDITERKQIEQALKASEQNFRNSIDNSLMGIRITDKDDHTFYANQAFLDIFQYKNTDEIKAFSSIDYYTPEEYTRYLLRKEKRERGEPTPDTFEIDIKRKDGTIRHLQVFRNEIFWDGKTRYENFYNDITERKQTEGALKASEQNFRNSLEVFLIGIRITSLDGYTLYSNQAFLDMFGYENIEEVRVSPPQDHYTPESYADYLRRKENFASGELLPDILKIDIIRKDGAIRHLHLFNKKVLWNGKEEYQGLYLDITERKQAEERLEQAAMEWRTTFDSITDLISIHDKDNRIVRVNKAFADMLKKTPKEFVGKFCHEVMHGVQEPPINCPHRQTLIHGKPTTLETFDSNLGLHFYEASSPILDEKGEITGSVIVARDITQQKRIEEQLIMTDRLASIGELSSGIAHELNNPLTSVIGFSQLLMEGDAPENIKKDLGIVYSEAQRAAVIVKNLLTFARKHAPVKQLSQVNIVIEDVLRLRAYEQKVNNIDVETHLASNLPEIMIDHFQMQQVFLNIVVNAEFAMLESHHRGKLTITTRRYDSFVKITITDDGPGISEENLKHIFDPFFTTKEVGKGTGLGLSICHGIVMEHGGKIYAGSEKGMGASFIVELPLINEQ